MTGGGLKSTPSKSHILDIINTMFMDLLSVSLRHN